MEIAEGRWNFSKAQIGEFAFSLPSRVFPSPPPFSEKVVRLEKKGRREGTESEEGERKGEKEASPPSLIECFNCK